MYCRKCGKEVAETSAFCPNCGERIGKEATAKKKIQISRKTCIVTALLVTMVLVSVVVYLNVIKKGEIHIESYQLGLGYGDGEPYWEYEIDSKEKKILVWSHDELVGKAFYCIGNNEIELLLYDEEGDEQGKEIIRFETENRGKTAYIGYIGWNEEGDIDWVYKLCLTEDNVITECDYNEEDFLKEYKIERGRLFIKNDSRDYTATCEIKENELKVLGDESPWHEIITSTDKIEGDDDIAELIFESFIVDSLSWKH